MSRNTIVVVECKNCGRDFRDGNVAERLHSKYCPTCQRAYNKAVDDFYNKIIEAYEEMKNIPRVEKSTVHTIALGIMEQLKNKNLAR